MSLTGLNYFEIFSLPQSFQVAGTDLDQAYKKLQSRYHPDRQAGDSDRVRALQQASLVNDAYDTLKSPLKRAAYLLRLGGVDPEQHNQAHLDEDFLIRQMVLRERLEALADTSDESGLDAMKAQVTQERDETLRLFETGFDAGELDIAKGVYNRLQFLFKLLEEIDAVEEKLLDY